LITNSLPAVISYVDADQRYRFNNAAYEKWFGISPQEASGRTIREVLGDRNYSRVRSHLDLALAGETVRFTQDIDLDGDRPVSVEGIYVPDLDETGAVRGIYILGMDVTELHSSKPQGLGMGLSVSRRIVTRHQGSIWFENEPGAGATFYVSLPLLQA
jgi:PAS domain S-box-containing protein